MFSLTERCPHCGLTHDGACPPEAGAGVFKTRDELIGALKPFTPGFHGGVWGRIKAFIVNGAPTRDEGIALARQITEWQAAIPESVHLADADRVPPFEGTDVMDGDENRP